MSIMVGSSSTETKCAICRTVVDTKVDILVNAKIFENDISKYEVHQTCNELVIRFNLERKLEILHEQINRPRGFGTYFPMTDSAAAVAPETFIIMPPTRQFIAPIVSLITDYDITVQSNNRVLDMKIDENTVCQLHHITHSFIEKCKVTVTHLIGEDMWITIAEFITDDNLGEMNFGVPIFLSDTVVRFLVEPLEQDEFRPPYVMGELKLRGRLSTYNRAA